MLKKNPDIFDKEGILKYESKTALEQQMAGMSEQLKIYRETCKRLQENLYQIENELKLRNLRLVYGYRS